MRTSPDHNSIANCHGSKDTRNCSLPAKIGAAVFALNQLVDAACTVSLEPNGRFLGDNRGRNDATTTDDATRTDAERAQDGSLQPRPDGGTILDAADATFDATDAADCHSELTEPCDAGAQGADGIASPDARNDTGTDAADAAPDAAPDAGPDATPDATPDAPDANPPLVCPPENCSAGQGICARQGDVTFDEQCNRTGCNAVAGEPDPAETCGDGLDNDCDERVDNGCECNPDATQPCYEGAEDTRNKGNCEDGIQICRANGRWSECRNQTLPKPEICDTQDNDCDDQTDEDVSRECSTDCGLGIETCGNGGFEGCNAPLPQPEICDGADNDCDTQTDEDCGLGNPCSGGQGVCRRNGQIVLDGQGGTQCSAVEDEPTETPERSCDGQDNDCDGATDETFTNQGQPCAAGVGECHRNGEMVCAPPIGVVCNAQPAAPAAAEACDNADNDCDGVTDETCPCADGVGACRHDGTIQENGACSAVAGEPAEELCNGADDDCDTLTDETFPEMAAPCSDGIGACERAGEMICEEGQPKCNAVVGEPAETPEKTCDGQDNDCDGQTDADANGIPLSQNCSSPVCNVPGQQICVDDQPQPCNAEDPDQDNDTIKDCRDNCPNTANQDQQDANRSGIGDKCEDSMDRLACENTQTRPEPNLEIQAADFSSISVFVHLGCANVVASSSDRPGQIFAHNIGTNPGHNPDGPRVVVLTSPNARVSFCVGTTNLTQAELTNQNPNANCGTYDMPH